MNTKSRKKRNSSGKCYCQICGIKTFLQIHHIHGRKIINPNYASNLVDICGNCHDAIHRGEVVIEGWISTTDGRVLIWHKNGEESFTGNDASSHLFK